MPVLRNAAVALLALLMVTACSSGGDESESSDSPGTAGSTESSDAAGADTTLRFVTPYTVRSLDPVEQGLWSPEWGYGELLMRATEDGAVEPWLLEALDADDATTWRLSLRPDVTFSNGNPLDAETLAAVFEHHLANNPLVEANLPGATITVEDDATLLLQTSEPVSNLPNLLAAEDMVSVFDAAALEAAGDDPQAVIDAGIYTGPYVVAGLDENEMTLERNDDYWGGDVALAGASVRFVPDEQARVRAVESGEADVALYPPTSLLTPLVDAGTGPTLAVAEQPLQQFRAIPNLNEAPMDDEAVRQAFALGLDYQAIAEQVLDGLYTAPTGLFPDSVGYALQTQSTAPGEAADLLEEAGWLPGDDGVREKDGEPLSITVLHYPQQPDTEQMALAMQSQLAEIGFDVTLELTDDNYTTMRESDSWDVGLSLDGTLGYTYDPVGRLRDFLTTDGERNFGGVSSTTLDGLVDELLAEPEPDQQRPLLEEAQQVIADEALVVIVAQRSSPAVVSEQTAGYRPSSVLHHLNASTLAG
ncbi:ABC transporter substrate-binding protein [Phytoactinopolyspora endophytica]|uniref:ABC transporter substrate-binding protein n=1 Tax=Phytoactinopolyspora endophytica TaxID=1642495 RepID=UPI0013ED7806|nr:ABC transporter substrate-binding protein [Phytoactinopolyspora endophytica]